MPTLAGTHLWLVRLDAIAWDERVVLGVIPDSEIEVMRSYRFEADRKRFGIGRLALRHLLAAEMNQPPQSFQIALTKQGRPYLPNCSSVDFNISHSGDRLMLALTHDAKVGVDIEKIRNDCIHDQVAKDCFTDTEYRQIKNAEPSLRAATFFSIWTVKEALLKASGEGIGSGLDHFSVQLSSASPGVEIVDFKDSRYSKAQAWQMPSMKDYVGAVAILPRGEA